MARKFTTEIPETQCMGDSLETINNNYNNLDLATQILSSSTITVNNSPSIDLWYDSKTRNLSAEISLSYALSAFQVSTAFKSFRHNLGDKTQTSYNRSSFYLSQDNTFFAAGSGGGNYCYGQGVGTLNTASFGFCPLTVPLDAGDYIKTFYTAGHANLYVLTQNGKLYGTGINLYGQLGDGTNAPSWIWKEIQVGMSSKVIYFDCSNGLGYAVHCLAITDDGYLYAWGNNQYGQLGTSKTSSQIRTPSLITLPAGTVPKKCYAIGGGDSSATAANQYGYSYLIDQNNKVLSTGANKHGQLASNDTVDKEAFSSISDTTLQAEYILGYQSGEYGTTFLIEKTTNTLWACGNNLTGQIGVGVGANFKVFTKPRNITGSEFVSVNNMTIFGGNKYLSVVVCTTNGTLKVWGYNGNGQLGFTTTTIPVSYTNLLPSPTNVKKVVSAGVNSVTVPANSLGSCWVLTSAGEIYGTGYNLYGQLGIGSLTNTSSFTLAIQNNNINFTDIEAYGDFLPADTTKAGSVLLASNDARQIYACGYNLEHNTGIPYTTIPMASNPTISVLQKTTIRG
jgi:alpha-tubulin suppressor-like RCC1 family protein